MAWYPFYSVRAQTITTYYAPSVVGSSWPSPGDDDVWLQGCVDDRFYDDDDDNNYYGFATIGPWIRHGARAGFITLFPRRFRSCSVLRKWRKTIRTERRTRVSVLDKGRSNDGRVTGSIFKIAFKRRACLISLRPRGTSYLTLFRKILNYLIFFFFLTRFSRLHTVFFYKKYIFLSKKQLKNYGPVPLILFKWKTVIDHTRRLLKLVIFNSILIKQTLFQTFIYLQ